MEQFWNVKLYGKGMRMKRTKINRMLALALTGTILCSSSTELFAEEQRNVTFVKPEYLTGLLQIEPQQLDMSSYEGNGYFVGSAADYIVENEAESLGEGAYYIAEALPASVIYESEWDRYSTNYYYNLLDNEAKAFWDGLDAMCLEYLTNGADMVSYFDSNLNVTYNLTDYVYSSDLSYEEMIELGRIFRYSNPQYYFLQPMMYYIQNGNGMGVSFVVYDIFAKGSDRKAATRKFKAEIKKGLSCVNGCSSDYEKVKAIHDYICSITEYNYGALKTDGTVSVSLENTTLTQTAYSTFCYGSTVCTGYMQAFTLLCNGADIDAIPVSSIYHAWNKVRIEDSWYNVDCTWADQQTYTNYGFFARSDHAYDTLLSESYMHILEEFWKKYVPTCSLDSGSADQNVGCLPAITEQTEPVAISVEEVLKHDKKLDEDYISCYKVTLSTATPGATIYYTTDGTIPSPASSKSVKYEKPFKLTYAENILAVAVCDRKYDSDVATIDACKAISYKITYVTNGGKNSKANPKSYTQKDDTIKLDNPTRKGYRFGGWYETKEFNSSRVKQIKKGSTGVVCLYAKWLPNKYKIKYSGNGATSGSMSTKQYQYDSSFKLSANKYKKTGYTFVGWSTKKNGKGKIYSNKDTVKNLSAEHGKTITLYAQWKKNK